MLVARYARRNSAANSPQKLHMGDQDKTRRLHLSQPTRLMVTFALTCATHATARGVEASHLRGCLYCLVPDSSCLSSTARL